MPLRSGTSLRVHVTVGDWAPNPDDCVLGNTTHPDWHFQWEGGPAGALAAARLLQFQGVAVVPATELSVSEYTVRVVATPRRAGLAVQVRTIIVPILVPPTYDPGPGPDVARAPLSVAVDQTGAVSLSTSPGHWRTGPGGSPVQYCFMVQSPEGLLVPIPTAPGFSPSPEARVPLPWLPHRRTNASTYTFALLVRDAHATQAGPFLAVAGTMSPAPSCAASCAPPRALLRDVACGLCRDDGYRPDQDLLSALGGLPATATRHQRLGLLHEAALVALRFGAAAPTEPPGLTPAAGLEATHRLLKAAAPVLDDDTTVALVLRAADALLYRGPEAGVHIAPATVERVLAELVLAARDQRDACAFQGLAVHSPHLQAALHRVPPGVLPAVLRLPARNVSVELPVDVWHAVAPAVGAEVIDVLITAVPPTGLLVTDVVAVSLWGPLAGLEAPVQDLPKPITIHFGAALHSPRFSPSADLYQCVRASPSGWFAEGAWLALPPAGGPEFSCRVAHAAVVAIQPLPRVQAVRGCGLDLPPSTLLCAASVPPLTITGVHFGPGGARVTLQRRPDGVRLPCPRVHHVPGAEEAVLVCTDLRLPADTPEPRWFSVTVRTAQGTAAALPRALLASGYPELRALQALDSPSGRCAQAAPHALTDCPQDATRFGLHGGFHVQRYSRALAVRVGALQCPTVKVLNATYLECEGLAGAEQGLPVVVVAGGAASQPRGFTLSFEPPCAHKPGFWAGAGCLECRPGYYGAACEHACPGAAAGAVCGGHGTCSDGKGGRGQCTCGRGAPASGHWTGEGCAECAGYYWGPQCNNSCASPAGLLCGGHGVCDGRATADAGCRCTNGYAGLHCGLRCPSLGAQSPCWGHGTCTEGPVRGVGVCACDRDPLRGHWAPPACDRCADAWVGPRCSVPCPVAAGLPCAGHGQCVAVGEAAVCQCAVGYAGPGCASACPVDGSGEVCGGHGACVAHADNASCACDPQWAGAACDTCAEGRTGVGCEVVCPANANGTICHGHGWCVAAGVCQCTAGYCGADCGVAPAVCATSPCAPGTYGLDCQGVCRCGAHGVCVDGRSGGGQCVCAPGWVGTACDAPCEGATIPVCGGHGRCDPATGACACDTAWRTLPGWPVCAASCPGPLAAPCGGHGECTAAAQCACDPGYHGPDCSGVCPTDAAGRWCAGHGRCDSATGCLCAGYWAGPACDACAEGYWGAACASRCLNGVSAARQCVCDVHWAGPNCSVPCPTGGLGAPCSGHGVCNSGSLGDGVCLCQPGYVGRACSLTCRGGADVPCSGHGTCSPVDGSCACHNSSAGHWAGLDCNACAAPYYGIYCDQQCPQDADGRMCSGHGECRDTSSCRCFGNHSHGVWRGALCAECAAGHYGAECRGVCPMRDCVPCSGHGHCLDGRAGDGACVCADDGAAGHWGGADCSGCAAGYWGPGCGRPCPGGAVLPCHGHGVCSAGAQGTGTCACSAGRASGWWAGDDCAVCRTGYYGPACAGVCACVHGACDDGLRGTGMCRCAEGYRGPTCSAACPRYRGRVCNGAGTCTANATCDCRAGEGGRFFAGRACQVCATGFTGPQCDLQCPVDAQGRVCAGVGACRAEGQVSVCDCRPGYTGRTCETECPGGALLPCTGHGVCSAGACACNRSTETGHWAGAECRVCAAGWSGPGCDRVCPAGLDGVPCAGYECRQGECMCALMDPLKCGIACDVPFAECDAFLCPEGRYGPDCGRACPEAGGRVCSGRGLCLARVYGTGRCLCDAGYVGDNCQWTCPTTATGLVCSGHGVCGRSAPGCVCFEGYGGPDCSRSCSLHEGLVCAGHGTCSGGQCVCAPGYAREDCAARCPGFDPAVPERRVCSAHGACLAATGECRCDAAPGRWGGVRCEQCAAGWFGPECTRQCVNGFTVQQVCGVC